MNRFHEHCAYDWAGARKRNQSNGNCHENRAGDSAFIGLLVYLVHNPRGQGDFKGAKEARGKNDKNEGEENIGNPVCAHEVGGVGSKTDGNDGSDDCIKTDQANRENGCIAQCDFAVVVFDEKRNRHGDHGEYARGEQGG